MCCKLQTDGMQYGYVKEGGCEKCIFAVTNVTNNFIKRKSDVFIVTSVGMILKSMILNHDFNHFM